MILLPNQLFFAEVEAMLAEGREVQIRMKGHSMRPLLRSERDQVVLTPCADPARLQPGDVVLFRCCGRHILHRIVRRDGERLTLAGDGNYRIMEQCTTRDVAGIAVRVIRASGRVVGCDSPGWQLRSRLWLAIPPWLRRQVLRVLWHSGWK
uniref:S26 family signal peptidase n=1 Tax=Alistipes shahii TaxID=328814 RepID=UPI003FF0184B